MLQDGVFFAANQLYGLTFKERHDLPVYQPDVRVFEVFDADGKPLALFYCRLLQARQQERRRVDGQLRRPVEAARHASRSSTTSPTSRSPRAGQPALLTFDDVTTMFHEFGHALHGMFSRRAVSDALRHERAARLRRVPVAVQRALGARAERVRATTRSTTRPASRCRRRWSTRSRSRARSTRASRTTEYLAASLLDMAWHTLPRRRAAAGRRCVRGRRRSSGITSRFPKCRRATVARYFAHIWDGGYAAGYYAYLWSEVLDDDAYAWFKEHGGLTRANGQRFRDMILSRGGTRGRGGDVPRVRGRDPSIEPLMEQRGLVPMRTQP